MVKRVIRHQETGKEYEVVGIDAENRTITIKGELAEFNEPLDWERLNRLGYKRATVQDDKK